MSRKPLQLRVVSGLGGLRPKQFLQCINILYQKEETRYSVSSLFFWKSIRGRKMITLDDLRGDSPALCGSFNKIRDEIRAVAKNKDEEDAMLTERILMDLIKFSQKKGLEKKKKKKRVRFISPKNPLNFEPKNSNHSQEEEGNSRKPMSQGKNPTEMKQTVEDQTPGMPTEVKDKIMGLHGWDVKLVIQKKLTDTDMKDSQDRLSIPRGQMKADFLTEEEHAKLEEKEEDGIHFKGLEVPLIEPSLKESAIFLKKWKLGNNSTYMLSSPWKDVVNSNGLKSGNIVQLWSFRVDKKPCLALINLHN